MYWILCRHGLVAAEVNTELGLLTSEDGSLARRWYLITRSRKLQLPQRPTRSEEQSRERVAHRELKL